MNFPAKITSVNYYEALTFINVTAASFKRKSLIRKIIRPVSSAIFCFLSLILLFGLFYELSSAEDAALFEKLGFLIKIWDMYFDIFTITTMLPFVFWIVMFVSIFAVPLVFSTIVLICVSICVKQKKINDDAGDEIEKAKKLHN